MKDVSPLERLATEPQRFSFDAAVRVLLHAARQAEAGEIVRFRSVPRLAYPPSDVQGLRPMGEGVPPDLTVSVMGLSGPSGVLPRGYAEVLNTALRARSGALHDFLDMLAHRMVARFADAGAKYRPNRMAETGALRGMDADPPGDSLGQVLLSLTGFGTPHLAPRLAAGPAPLMHYAGLLSAHPRSADRLRALVSDWLGQPIEVRQFAGAWLALPVEQQTRLPAGRRAGQFNQLGLRLGGDGAVLGEQEHRDAVLGVRTWDVQAGVVLRIGPLNRADFTALLPDRPALERLTALVRAYLGLATGFAVNLVVEAAEVPAVRLSATADPGPRLGWNTWLLPSGRRQADAADPLFAAEAIEARAADRGA